MDNFNRTALKTTISESWERTPLRSLDEGISNWAGRQVARAKGALAGAKSGSNFATRVKGAWYGQQGAAQAHSDKAAHDAEVKQRASEMFKKRAMGAGAGAALAGAREARLSKIAKRRDVIGRVANAAQDRADAAKRYREAARAGRPSGTASAPQAHKSDEMPTPTMVKKPEAAPAAPAPAAKPEVKPAVTKTYMSPEDAAHRVAAAKAAKTPVAKDDAPKTVTTASNVSKAADKLKTMKKPAIELPKPAKIETPRLIKPGDADFSVPVKAGLLGSRRPLRAKK